MTLTKIDQPTAFFATSAAIGSAIVTSRED
jgi:hypothetical protein